MIPYTVKLIPDTLAKTYIWEHHYSHGSHRHPKPCFGLYDSSLIGVLMFAVPGSERVRASIFGPEYVNHVTELHRLHILDITPKNTESWFISRCLKLLKQEKPEIWAVMSFSDTTEGHTGIIYQATNAYRIGMSPRATFYRDQNGRLRYPRQCGINISKSEALDRGWTIEKRDKKFRYLWLLPDSKAHKTWMIKNCKYDLTQQSFS